MSKPTKTFTRIPGLDGATPIIVEGDISGYTCRYCDHTAMGVSPSDPDWITGAFGSGDTERAAIDDFLRSAVARGRGNE